MYLTAPPEEFVPEDMVGKLAVGMAYLYAGDLEAGEEHAKPFRELGPTVDLVAPMQYADFQCMIDDPPDHYNYWSADYHNELNDDATDLFVASAHRLRCALTAAHCTLGRSSERTGGCEHPTATPWRRLGQPPLWLVRDP